MPAWFTATRASFCATDPLKVAGKLHKAAANQGWHIEPDQDEEWRKCVVSLQDALKDVRCNKFTDVILEYDFRRRGLRIDTVLFGPGAIFILEFKRGKLTSQDCEQVVNYCINLIEFHKMTQDEVLKVIPILVSRKEKQEEQELHGSWHPDWPQLLTPMVKAHADELASALHSVLKLLPIDSQTPSLNAIDWDSSPFNPSSTILDAALSLYGQHEVSAIKEHASAIEDIDNCIGEIESEIAIATEAKEHRLIFVSGAPGAGKTLVGLRIAFDQKLRNEAVFVTGNAPLVDVLNGSLRKSYVGLLNRKPGLCGYSKSSNSFVTKNTDFKIVKAHRFLDPKHGSTDGRILIFDEAQRTYEKGKEVNRQKLEDHEANLIIKKMEKISGSIIVLLLGHNQHINKSERGASAWLEAAIENNWKFSIAEATLKLAELTNDQDWKDHPLRQKLSKTHLTYSMRYYRNAEIERWAHHVMTNQPAAATKLAHELPENATIYISRDIKQAKAWVRSKRVGEERAGIIASGQARRLRAEGLFVGEKPDIVQWMLAPSSDIRSSNMLELVQNQYQIQGLEVDYAIVCWGADLRRENENWASYNVHGSGWQNAGKELEVRLNSYRVLLTRSRKGMVIFVPKGDFNAVDPTRKPKFYDAIYSFLKQCGATDLIS